MNIAVVDIECNGLDTETVDIHCIVLQRAAPGVEPSTYGPDEIEHGIAQLNLLIDSGYVLAGHNVIEYDFPILERYGMKPPGKVFDTLLMSRAAYPGSTLYAKDQAFVKRNPVMKGELKEGAHSLKAWGLRLGCPKDNYTGGWETFNQEMLDYCVQDVASNVKLLEVLRDRIPDEAALLECEVGRICRRMRLHGVRFDTQAAEGFTVTLAAKRAKLDKDLRDRFGAWVEPTKPFTPKRTQNRKHIRYVDGELVEFDRMEAGVPFLKGKMVEFNPASTDHIAHVLIEYYGWKPTNYTPGGKPQVTAEILADLRYPEAPALAEYQEIKKILGYVSEGTNAWLKLERKGRLHGKVNPTGTVTSRASHNSPNTGNVPSRTKLGHACRELFTVNEGNVMVGADAKGLQLRGLGHYLGAWDDGAFARQCEDGDIHEYMRSATGLHYRARQKNWTYARIFGAGDTKLGLMALLDWHDAFNEGLTTERPPKQSSAKRIGRQTLDNLGDAIPAFDKLQRALRLSAQRGWLRALDGRVLPVGSEHLSLAVLLQSFEACIMKKAMVLAADAMLPRSEFCLWVHDEFQVECPPEYADEVGSILVTSMAEAGRHFNLRVRIDGDYKVGKTWAETH